MCEPGTMLIGQSRATLIASSIDVACTIEKPLTISLASGNGPSVRSPPRRNVAPGFNPSPRSTTCVLNFCFQALHLANTCCISSGEGFHGALEAGCQYRNMYFVMLDLLGIVGRRWVQASRLHHLDARERGLRTARTMKV